MKLTRTTYDTYEYTPEEFLAKLGIPGGKITAAHTQSTRDGVEGVLVMVETEKLDG